MTPKKRRRLAFAVALIAAGGALAGGIVYELGQNVEYFRSPSDIAEKKVGPGIAFVLGGLVEQKSLHHGAGADVNFVVTDGKDTIPVKYSGVLPALFREGQGVVAMGAMNESGTFVATEVLAKHDEKYMPPAVVDALKRSGHWQEGGAPGPNS
jgi:cytochrome c-type biogenesis protein CcmE